MILLKNFLIYVKILAINQFEAEIYLQNSQPIFHKAYSVPLRLRQQVSDEIDRLVNQKILFPVRHSRWASPIVVVPKPNGSIRLCVDCGVTINKFIKTEHYPLPNIDDIFASLANCMYFCVIDLTGAYQQVKLSEESKEFLTINTHKGLFRYNTLSFGVASAPAIFQAIMDQILVNLPKVCCYLDDIIIGGSTEDECKQNLLLVLERLSQYNVKINLEKSKFLEKSVKYLGHILEYNKVRPNPEKMDAVNNAPVPKNVTQLQSYLGLINYYRRFIPNLSTELKDLYKLLGKSGDFNWSNKCDEAFKKSKELLTNNKILELYDPNKPIIVQTDASPYGVGAVMSHLVNGVEKPVLFAPSSLSPAEKNYSQLHREALAIIFAVKKFNKYIYGKEFTIVTDHQALCEIFNPAKQTPAVAAARLQRWTVILFMYKYKILHRAGNKMGNVDALSRLPLESQNQICQTINYLNFSNELPITFESIQNSTKEDKILSELYFVLLSGDSLSHSQYKEELSQYQRVFKCLSIENECIFYGNRVIIPQNLRTNVLRWLHESHLGVVRMKMVARSYVWWPGLDKEIEKYVQNCMACQSTANIKKEVVTTQWKQCEVPLERVHVDFFHFNGETFFLIVDSYSKFLEVVLMKKTDAKHVIAELQKFFVVYGLPKMMVSDNGPPFNSFEFNEFCKLHNIELKHSPAYHPQSNGLAERNVQIVKKVFKKFLLTSEKNLSITQRLNKFLIHHRNTPVMSTRKSPAELMLSYKPRTILDAIKMKNKNTLKQTGQSNNNKQFMSKNCSEYSLKNNVELKFESKEVIFYKNHKCNNIIKWIKAQYLKQISTLTHLIKVNGNVRLVHTNQIRKAQVSDKYPFGIGIYPNAKQNELNKSNVQRSKSQITSNNNKDSISAKSKIKSPESLPRNSAKRGRSPSSPNSPVLRRSKRIKNMQENRKHLIIDK